MFSLAVLVLVYQSDASRFLKKSKFASRGYAEKNVKLDPKITFEVLAHNSWNKLPQKPVSKAGQNFCKRLQACMDKAGGHLEHFIRHIQYCLMNAI